MSDCAEMQTLAVLDRLDALDGDQRAQLSTHLAGCDGCSHVHRAAAEELDASEANRLIAPADGWGKLAGEIEAEQDRDPSADLSVRLLCTFCHDSLPTIDAVYCASCLTPHHAECFADHGRCAAPGCAEERTVRALPGRSPSGVGRKKGLWTGLFLGIGMAVGVGVAALTSDPPPVIRPRAIRTTSTPTPEPGVPAWFVGARKPPLPLPDGILFGERPLEYVNVRDGSVLVYVPAATFSMGAGEERQRVVISEGYFIGKYEVTWAQYRTFCAATKRPIPGGRMTHVLADHPANNVTWAESRAYARWAGGDLPTEAEWEYAARGDDGRTYPWGNAPPTSGARCNMKGGAETYTSAVGSYPAGVSPFGAHDMAGNVAEWCLDWFGNYDGTVTQVDPQGPKTGLQRTMRGGCYVNGSKPMRAAGRFSRVPGVRLPGTGFRFALR